MEEIRIFLITYFAALFGVVAPGLVNISVAKICLEYGKKSGLYAALGASLVVLIQAIIAVLLARYIFDNPVVRNVLLRTGLVILVLLMVFFFAKARQGPRIITETKKSKRNSILKGAFVAAINIFPIPYFCAVAAALNLAGGVSYDLLLMALFCIAAALGTFSTLYFYVVSFKKIENKIPSFTKYSNYFMAALMLILAIVTLLKIYND